MTEPSNRYRVTYEWAYAETAFCTRHMRAMGYTLGEATRHPLHRGLVWPAVRAVDPAALVADGEP